MNYKTYPATNKSYLESDICKTFLVRSQITKVIKLPKIDFSKIWYVVKDDPKIIFGRRKFFSNDLEHDIELNLKEILNKIG